MSNYLGRSAEYGDHPIDLYSGDNVTLTYSLTEAADSETVILVFVDGIQLVPSSDYTVSGFNITFNIAPAVGVNNVIIRFLGKRVVYNQPASGTINKNELNTNVIEDILLASDSQDTIGILNSPLVDITFNQSLGYFGTGEMSYDRSTIAYYHTRNGFVEEAIIDEARFEKQGILLEGSSENLCLNSESNTWSVDWTNTNVAINDNDAIINPRNVSGVTKVTNSLANGSTSQTITISPSLDYTFSVYLKNSLTANSCLLTMDFDTNTDASLNVDLATGIISNEVGVTSSQVYTLANGWYRVQMTRTSGASDSSCIISVSPGNGASDAINIWGAQLEQLSFASSYMKTSATSFIRAKDILTLTSYDNLPIFNEESSFTFNVTLKGFNENSSSVQHILETDNEIRDIYIFGTTNDSGYISNASLDCSINNTKSLINVDDTLKVTVTQGLNTKLYFDQDVVAQGTLGTINTSPTSITIGNDLFGNLSNFRIYDKELNLQQVRFV